MTEDEKKKALEALKRISQYRTEVWDITVDMVEISNNQWASDVAIVEKALTAAKVDGDEVGEADDLACQHTWPSLDRSMSRKCMRCGVPEQEVFDRKRAETFAEI